VNTRRRLLAAAATVAVVAAGCSGSGHRTGQVGDQPPVTGATPSSSAPSPSTSVYTPVTTVRPADRCTDQSVIATWPLAQRAAEVLAIPALGADPVVIRQAVSTRAGGVLLIGDLPAAGPLAADLRAALPSGRGPAPLVMVDEEGGGIQRLGGAVTAMPWARQMAATMSTGEVRALAQQVGRQMKALGVGVDLAPVLDLDGGATLSRQDPDGPRSFSTDPTPAANYGLAFASGLEAGGVLPVVKHFPGLGGATANTDYGPASTPPVAVLQKAGLVPFERAVSAGVPAVMVSNASVPGLSGQPASVSPAVVTGWLRERLHFGGLVLTDSLSAGAITSAGMDVDAASVAALNAGVDMILFGSTLTPADTAALAPGPLAAQTRSIVGAITDAVRSKKLAEARLDDAVLHVVRAQGAHLCGPAGG
jgi:beta-N-acetylhexosaminidase